MIKYSTDLHRQIHELYLAGETRMAISDKLGCEYSNVNRVIRIYGKDNTVRRPEYKAVTQDELELARDCIRNGMSAKKAHDLGKFPERTHNSISYIYNIVRTKMIDYVPPPPSSVGGSLDLELAIKRSEAAYMEEIKQKSKPFPMPKVSILQEKDPEQVKADRLKRLEEIQPQHSRLNNPINKRSALFHKIMSGDDVNLDNL